MIAHGSSIHSAMQTAVVGSKANGNQPRSQLSVTAERAGMLTLASAIEPVGCSVGANTYSRTFGKNVKTTWRSVDSTESPQSIDRT